MSREAMQMALEALEEANQTMSFEYSQEDYYLEAINALRQALETEKQEPVAWRTFDGEGGYDYRSYEMNETYDKEWAERNPNHKGWVEPLYTAPLKREWVGLTYEEIGEVISGQFAERNYWVKITKALEAKLKEKNG